MKIKLFRIAHVMEIRSVFSDTDHADRLAEYRLPLLLFVCIHAACNCNPGVALIGFEFGNEPKESLL
jgi:hypothetical protein